MRRFAMIPIALILLFTAGISTLSACEIEVKIMGEQKEFYKSGDTLILKVTVFLTHRDCPEGIKTTKFKGEGMKLLGAKKWKQTKPELFSRLVKVKITDPENGVAILHARRSCDKEGGYGVLKVNVH